MYGRSELAAIIAVLTTCLALTSACGDDDVRAGLDAGPGLVDGGHDSGLGTDAGPSDAGTPDAGAGSTEVVRVDLGTFAFGDEVVFEVEEGTVGLHLVAQADRPMTVGFDTVRSPSGAIVVSGYSVVPGFHSSAIGTTGIGATSIPQNGQPEALGLEPGGWTAVVGGGSVGTGEIRVTAIVRRGTTMRRALDLHIYLPEGLMLDGEPLVFEDAAAHEGLNVRIDSFFSGLDSLFEVGRGRVSYHALDAELRVIADELDLERTFQNRIDTRGEPAPGAHVFLANGVTVYDTPVWGVAGGAPGAMLDTPQSMGGVALDVSAGFPPVADGLTLVHELGHFVGLFHSSSTSGTFPDVLDDTPECTLTTGFSRCPDARNIMHAVFYGASGGGMGLETSPLQRRIFEGSPIWREAGPGDGETRSGAMEDEEDARREGQWTPTTELEHELMTGLCAHEVMQARGRHHLERGLERGPEHEAERAEAIGALADDPAVPAIIRAAARRRLRP
jgi:hypothetical protein